MNLALFEDGSHVFGGKKKSFFFLKDIILCNFSVQTLQYFQKKIKFIFCPWKLKKRASNVAHNQPQTFFSLYWPGCPNHPRIDSSYYKYVPRLICLLICGFNFLPKENTPSGLKKWLSHLFYSNKAYFFPTLDFFSMLGRTKAKAFWSFGIAWYEANRVCKLK